MGSDNTKEKYFSTIFNENEPSNENKYVDLCEIIRKTQKEFADLQTQQANLKIEVLQLKLLVKELLKDKDELIMTDK